MVTPSEREYVTYPRGQVREDILRDLREGLRARDNPATRLPFTEDELSRAMARGSRFYREADAIDLILLGVQQRDEFFAQQVRIDRAGSAWLRSYHAPLWGESFLPAFGGSGTVTVHGNPGTIWPGSTLVPDPFAVIGTDPGLRRYQVLITGEADAQGNATLQLLAIDGGDETNPIIGTPITWSNPPPGSDPAGVVSGADFRGGFDAETDADFAKRLMDRIRHKPASGNWAHFRSWARAASVSVEDAFVYPCAFHAGSVLVALTGKRGAIAGPLGRVPSFGLLSTVTAVLVPPGSPLVPGRVHVVVVGVQPEPSDAVVQLAQPFGSPAGWVDREPFPAFVAELLAPFVVEVTSPTEFVLIAGAPGLLPQGATGPVSDVHLMVWDVATSAFESLAVDTVEELTGVEGGVPYRVTLTQAPVKVLAHGDNISPDMARRDVLAEAMSDYFDSLGPGEVIDLEEDERSVRAFRNPVTSEEYPSRAGQSAISFIVEALGAPVNDATLASISKTAPSLPSDSIDGPFMLTLGQFAVYPLT